MKQLHNCQLFIYSEFEFRFKQLPSSLRSERPFGGLTIAQRANETRRRVNLFSYVYPISVFNLIQCLFLCSVYPKWEFSHITLPVKNLLELKMHFRDLLRPPIPNWSTQCKRILSQQHAPLCQHALKKGQTPKPLRGELWSFVLGSHNFVNVINLIC